jgi:hypothetical protein
MQFEQLPGGEKKKSRAKRERPKLPGMTPAIGEKKHSLDEPIDIVMRSVRQEKQDKSEAKALGEAIKAGKTGLTAEDVQRAHAEAAAFDPEEAEWQMMISKAKEEGAGEAAEAAIAEAGRQDAARFKDESDQSFDEAGAHIAESYAKQEAAGAEQELAFVRELAGKGKIELFGQERHADLKKEFDRLTDEMTNLKPWNFLKRRGLEKQVTEVMRQMDMNLENYESLKRDLARAEHDSEQGDPKLKKVYEAEARNLRAELAPMEEAVAEATHAEMGDRQAEKHGADSSLRRASRRIARGGSGGTGGRGGIGRVSN